MLPTAKLLPDSSALWVPVALTIFIKFKYFLKMENFTTVMSNNLYNKTRHSYIYKSHQ